jgi:uncharacterized protein (DUF2267 family)
VNADSFQQTVAAIAGISHEEAERAAHATLRTLGERITRGEADDIASFLPRELRSSLTDVPEPAQSFGLAQFIRRVAERDGVDEATAYRHAQAVFAALGKVVPERELKDMAAQLPREFDPLLGTARSGQDERVPVNPLTMKVAQLTSLSLRCARRALDAVLETLAERISEGEVEDLLARLPPDLIPPLRRGLDTHRGARRMSLDEFLDRVAEREGVDREEAERHARAVFAALREAIPSKEIDDVESELSAEYAPLFSNII